MPDGKSLLPLEVHSYSLTFSTNSTDGRIAGHGFIGIVPTGSLLISGWVMTDSESPCEVGQNHTNFLSLSPLGRAIIFGRTFSPTF